MNNEMEELSDAELDAVSGGGLGLADTAAYIWWGFKGAVKETIHDVAQAVADATK